ncbi:MAG: DUF421 domain-containing protein [Eubacteriales bacterium]
MEILKLILTSLFSASALFVLAKLMGHKQMSQLDFFDYITGITIGSIAAELATELEEPWKPLTAMTVYGVLALSLSIATNKFPKSRKYINGTPTVIMNNGKIYRDNMKKAKLDLSEFLVMCREKGFFNLGDIQTAVFEYNGKLTILPTSAKRPITPSDMNLSPGAEHICTEVIMDGRILEGNLKSLGLDQKWLQKQLEFQGFHSAKEIALGICSEKSDLMLFEKA